jgi:hypothetical protein
MAEKLYGTRRDDLGLVDLSPVEMMFWLYCPIKTAGPATVSGTRPTLQFLPIVNAVDLDIATSLNGQLRLPDGQDAVGLAMRTPATVRAGIPMAS